MQEFKTLTRDELQTKIENKEDFTLIDTLGDQSYSQAHIPGAVSISAKEDDFAGRVEEQIPDKDKEVIVYCGSFSCQLSPKAAGELVEAGYTRVFDYEGGLKDWAEGGKGLEGENAEAMEEKLSSEE